MSTSDASIGPGSETPGVLRRLLDGLYLLSGYLAGCFLLAIFVLMLALSGGRPAGINIVSGDDLTSWCMASMAFLELAHTFKSGEMIRVGLLIDRLSGKTRWFTEIFALMLAALFIGFFAWHAVDLVITSHLLNDMSTGVLVVPLWLPQLGFTAGLIILFIAIVDELVHVALGNKPRYEKEPPKTAEEVIERAVSSGV